MRVRPRQESDLAACLELLSAVHASDGYPMNLPPDPATFLVPPDLLGAWVAEAGDGLVGHVALRSRTSAPVMEAAAHAVGVEAGRLGVVARLLVSPDARRRGVGRQLLATAAGRALELGRHPVLDVVSSHTAAIALYERAGWHRAAQVRVTFSSGQSVDELVYLAPVADVDRPPAPRPARKRSSPPRGPRTLAP